MRKVNISVPKSRETGDVYVDITTIGQQLELIEKDEYISTFKVIDSEYRAHFTRYDVWLKSHNEKADKYCYNRCDNAHSCFTPWLRAYSLAQASVAKISSNEGWFTFW